MTAQDIGFKPDAGIGFEPDTEPEVTAAPATAAPPDQYQPDVIDRLFAPLDKAWDSVDASINEHEARAMAGFLRLIRHPVNAVVSGDPLAKPAAITDAVADAYQARRQGQTPSDSMLATLVPDAGIPAGYSNTTPGKVANATGAISASIPSMAAGPVPMISQIVSSAKGDAYAASKQQGKTDAEAEDDSNVSAGVAAALLPVYMAGGKVASAAVSKMLAENTPAVGRAVMNALAQAGTNLTIDATVRKAQGGSLAPSAEDLVAPIAFGVHGGVEAAESQHEALAKKAAAAGMPLTADAIRDLKSAKPTDSATESTPPNASESDQAPEPVDFTPDETPDIHDAESEFLNPEQQLAQESLDAEPTKDEPSETTNSDADTRGNPEISGGDGQSPFEKLAAETRAGAQAVRAVRQNASDYSAEFESLVDSANKSGFHPGEFLDDKPWAFGNEHDVWWKPGETRVTKATKPNKFGLTIGLNPDATPAQYFDRMALQNRVFNDDVRPEGVAAHKGQLRFITSQPYIEGRPATQWDMESMFSNLGFTPITMDGNALWYRPSDKSLSFDAHPRNFVVTKEGVTVPIDANIVTAPKDIQERIDAEMRKHSDAQEAPVSNAPLSDRSIADAYQKAVDRTGFQSVPISELAKEMGVSESDRGALHDRLMELRQNGSADFQHGDWSLADPDRKAWAVTAPGDDYPSTLVSLRGKPEEWVSQKTDAASKAIDEQKGGMKKKPLSGQSGFSTLHDIIADAGHAIFRVGMDFARWSKEMLRQIGEKVRPYLHAAWKAVATGGGTFREGKGQAGAIDLKGAWKEMRDIDRFSPFKAAVNKVSATMQRTYLEGKDVQRKLQEMVPDRTRRSALTPYIESAAESARTGETRQQVLDRWAADNKNKDTQAKYDAAKSLTPAEKSAADNVSKFYEQKLALAKKWGVLNEGIDAYVNRKFKNRAGESQGMGGGSRIAAGAGFQRHRFYESAFKAEQPYVDPATGKTVPGLEHVTDDPSELMPIYSTELNKVIAQRQLIQDLSKITAADGRPAVVPKGTPINAAPDPHNPDVLLNFPENMPEVLNKTTNEQEGTNDYKQLTGNPRLLQKWHWIGKTEDGTPILQQSDLAIHPEFARHVDNITKGSALADWYNSKGSALASIPKALAKGVDRAQTVAKEAMFALSGFHYATIAEHAAEHRVNPLGEIGKTAANLGSQMFGRAAHKMVTDALGIRSVDYRDPNVTDWTRHSLMLAPDHVSAKWFMEGVGGTTAIRRIPVLGKIASAISDDLFGRFIPALKLRMANTILDRNMQTYSSELASGKVSIDDVKYLTSHQVNAALSHLNMVDLGRNPTLQHFLRLAVLAPDFTESRGRFIGQAAKAVVGSKAGREQLGAIALGGGLLYATCRILNQVLDGDPHFEAKHAFSIVNGNRSYEVRSVQGDVLKAATNMNQFAQGRLSPIAKFAEQQLSGVNYRGEKLQPGESFKELLGSYLPISMRSLPGVRDLTQTTKQSPVSPLEQFAGAMGVHTSRYSPIADTYSKAHDWMTAQGKPADTGVYPVSKYQQLRYALEDGDMARASDEYAALRKSGMTPDKIAKGFDAGLNHPFTGNKETDVQFKQSLNPHDRAIYNSAIESRERIMARFSKLH